MIPRQVDGFLAVSSSRLGRKKAEGGKEEREEIIIQENLWDEWEVRRSSRSGGIGKGFWKVSVQPKA